MTENAASSRTVAVTGSTGFVGRAVVAELIGRGWTVRALTRHSDKADSVLPDDERVQVVVGEATDGATLDRLLRGADACVHLIGIIREAGGQTFKQAHVSTTRAVLDACGRQGVSRYVHMSALGVGPEGRAQYQKTKWEAEELVRRSGLEWTIFRPSMIHGAGSEFVQMVKQLASGEVPPYFFMPYFVRERPDRRVPLGAGNYESASLEPILVDDVARAFAEALEHPGSIGEVYPLVGPERVTWPELMACLRDNLPGTRKDMGTFLVPGEHGRIIATVAKTLGLGSLLPFDAGMATMAMEDSTANGAKARAHLGVDPAPFRQSVQTYAGAVR